MYANDNSIPILAKNGGHGSIKGLGQLRDGIQITLARLNGITVHDNNTATVQGGAPTYLVRDALWEQQKQTSTPTARLLRRLSTDGSSDRGL
jgi:FAD/FMN-containing dehydrogenase